VRWQFENEVICLASGEMKMRDIFWFEVIPEMGHNTSLLERRGRGGVIRSSEVE